MTVWAGCIYRARQYDPMLGRFMQADTITVDGLNRYTHVRNNPTRFTDPSGKYRCPVSVRSVGGQVLCTEYGLSQRAGNGWKPRGVTEADEASRFVSPESYLEPIEATDFSCDAFYPSVKCEERHKKNVVNPWVPILTHEVPSWEVAACAIVGPSDCARANTLRKVASELIEQFIGNEGDFQRLSREDGARDRARANAFRHALWAALMEQAIGEDEALTVLTAHEAESGKVLDTFVDIHNNAQGLAIGAELPRHQSVGAVALHVYEALAGGFLACPVRGVGLDSC
jgi:hypothetical protein